MKPVDLKGIRKLTLAEIRERRHREEQGKPKKKTEYDKKPWRRQRRNSPGAKIKGRTVVITSVSIRPELKVRAERVIGKGNFSRAVTIALTEVLLRKAAERDAKL